MIGVSNATLCIRPKPKINTNICFYTSFWPIFKIHVLTCSQFFFIFLNTSLSFQFNKLESSLPRNALSQVLWIYPSSSGERSKTFKMFYRRTDRQEDGQKVIIKYSFIFFQLRWAKNKGVRIYSFISSLHFYIVIVIDKNNQCQKFKNSKTTSKHTCNLSMFTLICWI